MSDFEKFKGEYFSQDKFYSSLTDSKISDREYEHVLNVWNKCWNENGERLSWLVFEMCHFIISNVFEFFEKGARSRIFYISNRYSKANKNYLKFYDSKQEWKHIIFLDVNNLYGNAMSKFFQQVDSNE